MKNFTKISLKIVSILAIVWSNQSFGMLRRFAPKAGLPTTAVTLAQNRALCGDQGSDPMWIKANHAVERFREIHGMKKIKPEELEQMSQQSEKTMDLLMGPVGQIPESYTAQQKISAEKFKTFIQPVLKKHDLENKVHVRFIDIPDKVSPASAGGNSILINKDFLNFDPTTQIAIIEHELTHIMYKDPAYTKRYKEILHANPLLKHTHLLLFERRADTHSSIQSKSNAQSLLALNKTVNGGYAQQLKNHEMVLCLNDTTLNEFEKAQKLECLTKKPTYLEELVTYMTKKEAFEKTTPDVIVV